MTWYSRLGDAIGYIKYKQLGKISRQCVLRTLQKYTQNVISTVTFLEYLGSLYFARTAGNNQKKKFWLNLTFKKKTFYCIG